MKRKTIRKRLIDHIHSVNKVLTPEHLSELSNGELLANAHPFDRDAYKKQFEDSGIPLYSSL